MPDGRRRSREHWTDTMQSGPPQVPAHVHRLAGSVRWALAGLVAAVALLLVAVGLMAVYVHQANQYVQGRGEYRNAEAARLDDRIDQVVCDILGEFPAGEPRADRLRVRYDCPIPETTP
jgi:hypothetical protein